MSSPITLSSLTTLPRARLASLLSNPDTASRTAIIDVRDSDHIGGHIKSSTWIPVAQLDARIPELLRLHMDKDRVVFHCMLSQVRGPASALKFARAQQRMREVGVLAKVPEDETAEEREVTTGDADGNEPTKKHEGPEVCVLQGGFDAWQAIYGRNEKLTEGYVKDLWE